MRGAFFLSGHNAGHQGDLRSLRDRGLGSDEVFLAMMSSGNRTPITTRFYALAIIYRYLLLLPNLNTISAATIIRTPKATGIKAVLINNHIASDPVESYPKLLIAFPLEPSLG